MLALILLTGVQQPVRAQEVPCENAFTEASNRYLFGRFDEASSLLEACLKQEAFSDEEKQEVYKLLVRIYDARQLEQKVKENLAQLLALVPSYEPGPDDPPRLKQLVASYKREMEQAVEEAPVEERPVEEAPEPEAHEGPPVEAPAPQPVLEVTLAREQGPAVRNARLQQEGGRVVIVYDLVGTARKYRVRLLLSTDGGGSFEALPQAVTGDVGKGIRPGAGKQVAWAALEDIPEGMAGDRYRLQVEARKQGGKGLLYVLGGAVVAGGGVTAALLLGGGDGNGATPAPPGIPTPPGRPAGN